MTPGVRYRAVNYSWLARGYASPDRAEPTYGSYKPDASTTGFAGRYATAPVTSLTPHYGDINVTTDGTVLSGLDIHGRVVIHASNVTIRSCRIRGNNTTYSSTGLVECSAADAGATLIEDCLLVPDTPNTGWTGVLGHDYTVKRCEVYHAVDGFGGYNTYNNNGPANVELYGNYVHDLFYYGPDPGHADGHTHNDCMQIQGNSNYRIVGNFFEGTVDASIGTPTNPTGIGDGLYGNPYLIASTGKYSVTGQVIGITPNVGAVSNVVIDKNWLTYGAQTITIILGKFAASDIGTITNNVFDTRTNPLIRKTASHGQVPDETARRAVLVTPTDIVANFPTSTDFDTQCGNIDYDGSPIKIYRIKEQ